MCRKNKQEKALRGAMCWKNPDVVTHIGVGKQYGTPGVAGSGESDGAAQWYMACISFLCILRYYVALQMGGSVMAVALQ